MSVPVVVASPEADCPASRALTQEGIKHELCLTLDDFQYGALWWGLWNESRTFIVIEWDIVPWPGAVTALTTCTHPWCTYAYPLHPIPGGSQVTTSFGINKVSPKGKSPEHWVNTKWDALDGQVVPVLRERLGDSHIHFPPVAHAPAPRR